MRKLEIVLLGTVFLFSLLIGSVATDAQATSEIIFRPGPGKNDGSDNGSANGGKDTLISRWYDGTNDHRNRNFGSETGIGGSPRTTCNPSDTKAYIQFDLSTLPANVQQVFFGVTHNPHTTYCYSNCNADFYFYPVSQAWNEMTLTFNTMPPEGAAVYGPINITFPNDLGTREYDITGIYRNWKNGSVPNYGLAIYSPTVGCNNAAVGFNVYSSDHQDQTLRPYLRILSDTPPPPSGPPQGVWAIDGTMKITLKILSDGNKFFEVTLNFSDLAAMGETFNFNADGSFEDGFGLLAGQWTQSGTKFEVELSQDRLGTLNEMGIYAEKASGSFTGSIQKSTIKGKFSLVLDIYGDASSELADMNLDGSSLTVSGSYVGSPDYLLDGLLVSHPTTFAGQNRAKSKSMAKTLAETIKAKILQLRLK